MKPEQKDLFTTPTPTSGSPQVIIELRGQGPIPSFKNKKRVLAWLDKAGMKVEFRNGHYWVRKDTIKIKTGLITLPEHQTWMDNAISRIESKLRSFFRTIGVTIQTAASARSLIASCVPCDDCWTSFREVVVKSELCERGHEGATIRITKL
jgi:hypothetical protein